MSKQLAITANATHKVGKKAYLTAGGVHRKAKAAYLTVPNFIKRELPSGYTQVEYIESTGTQYIDTGFKSNQNTKIEVGAAMRETHFFLGAIDGSLRTALFILKTGTIDYAYGASGYTTTTITGLTYPAIITLENGKITAGDKVYNFAVQANHQMNYSITLFAQNSNGQAIVQGGICYYCKIYDGNTLARELIPCINANGAAGMYDLVNGVFYANAGSGTFAVGDTYKLVHQLCYKGGADVVSMVIGYSGNMIDNGVVTMSGKQYRLLRLTSSGTLTVSDEVNAEVWMCGGGTSGVAAYTNGYEAGGGGAGAFTVQKNVTLSGGMAAVVGAGGGSVSNGSSTGAYNKGGISSFAGIETPTNFTLHSTSAGVCGGTGGGSATSSSTSTYIGTGDGIDKYPFNDVTFDNVGMCAGGGAGNTFNSAYDECRTGGNGGSGGGNGSRAVAKTWGSGHPSTPSSGGWKGGGLGGAITASSNSGPSDGGAATYYGGAGGGGAFFSGTIGLSTKYIAKGGGAGYQGIIYIRIPVEQ